jgi:hypothetical protein
VIFNFLVYAVIFGALMSVVALCLESLAVIRDKSRRLHWLLAMLCSALFPPLLALNAQPGQPASRAAPMPALFLPAPEIKVAPAFGAGEAASQQALTASSTNAPAVSRAWRVPTPSGRTLLFAWAAISAALLSILVGTGILLRRRPRFPFPQPFQWTQSLTSA